MKSTQRKITLARVDLNLLVILDLLLKERHVSRVAEKMFVSQSAISRSLKKLRELFDDPLFTRTAKGLVPSYMALQLEKELNQVLPALSTILNRTQFEPASCDDTIRLSVPPFFGTLLIPKLFSYLQQHAPKVSLIEETTKSNSLQLLDSNQIDFAFHYQQPRSPNYHSFFIGEWFPVLYVRCGHPLLEQDTPTLENILSFPVVGHLIEDEANATLRMPILAVLQDLVHQHRKPSLRTSQTGTLLKVVKESDSVLFGANGLETLPEFADELQKVHSFRDSEDYVLPIHLLYHQRNANSEAHKWLAEVIVSLSQTILGSKAN